MDEEFDAFCFHTYSDAECNARLILDRLDDSDNRRVGLKCAKAELRIKSLMSGGGMR